MKISLLHPSRSRAKKSLATVKEWIDKAGNVNVETIISIDKNDPDKDHYFHEYSHNWMLNPNADHRRSFLTVNNNDSVVQATNKAAKHATGDILVYLSDDFKCPENWAELVIKEFENEQGPLLIKVNDCLQPFDVAVLTIPIMNRALYERLGYFWHPGYKSMFVDEDLYWTSFHLNVLKACPHLSFPHHHHTLGLCPEDETYRRSAANWVQGQDFFAKRKEAGFPS